MQYWHRLGLHFDSKKLGKYRSFKGFIEKFSPFSNWSEALALQIQFNLFSCDLHHRNELIL